MRTPIRISTNSMRSRTPPINSALSNALTQMRQREVQIAELIPQVNSMEGQSERHQAMKTIYVNDLWDKQTAIETQCDAILHAVADCKGSALQYHKLQVRHSAADFVQGCEQVIKELQARFKPKTQPKQKQVDP